MVDTVFILFGSLVFLLANQRIVVRLDDIQNQLRKLNKKGDRV